MKKNKYKCLILCVIFLCQSGFKVPEQKGPEGFDMETINRFVGMQKKGVVTSFIGNPEMRGTQKQASYWLKENEEFKGKFFIGNYNDFEETFFIISLLNYKQVDFLFDGRKAWKHVITLNPKESKIFHIELPSLKKKAYDFLLLTTKTSSENPTEKKLLKSSIYLNAFRANIFKGSKTFPERNIGHMMVMPTEDSESKFFLKNKENGMGHTTVRESNSINNVELHLSNVSDENIVFSLLVFKDYRQVSYDELFYVLPPQKEATIPVIHLIEEKKHDGEFFVLKVLEPYIPLEKEGGVLTSANIAIEPTNKIIVSSDLRVPGS